MTYKKFNLNLKEFPKLQQVNGEKGRHYETENKDAYPSITTVLSATADKTALNKWRQRVGAEAAQRISVNATTRGTKMHDLCEKYLLNEIEEVKVSDAGEMLFLSIRPALDRMDNIRCLESRLFSTSLQVAGSVDCIAELDGVLTVIDFKTASKPKKEEWIQDYFMQGCFYFTAYYELTGELPSQVTILIAVQDGTLQEFTLKGKQIIYYTEMLKKRIEAYYYNRSMNKC